MVGGHLCSNAACRGRGKRERRGGVLATKSGWFGRRRKVVVGRLMQALVAGGDGETRFGPVRLGLLQDVDETRGEMLRGGRGVRVVAVLVLVCVGWFKKKCLTRETPQT